MDPKAALENQDNQKSQVSLVFVVTREIQVLKVKRGPHLLGPQALLGHPECLVRKECQETLHLVIQGPQERGVFQECQG